MARTDGRGIRLPQWAIDVAMKIVPAACIGAFVTAMSIYNDSIKHDKDIARNTQHIADIREELKALKVEQNATNARLLELTNNTTEVLMEGNTKLDLLLAERGIRRK